MIVVTGAAGFIGQHLTQRLLAAGDAPIVAVDNLHRGAWGDLTAPAAPDRLTVVEGDVRDPALCTEVMAGADTVFHLAAQSNVIGALEDTRYSFETNVAGTFNVLSAAQAAGVQCVVLASSREVYGEPDRLPVPEAAPLTAKNPYGASKVAAEAYARVFDGPAMRVVILRLANVYGPGDRGRVIPIFLDRARRGEPLILYGGQQVIDFVPVDLVVDAFLRAAEIRPAGPINVGSGRGTALTALADRVLALTGSPAGTEVVPARTAEVVRFVADVTRMQAHLGIDPPADPLAGLESMAGGGTS